MISAPAHAAILRRVALVAMKDARAAWKLAHDTPTERRIREALRACTFAALALRRAADALPDEAAQLRASAKVIGESVDDLAMQLARAIER